MNANTCFIDGLGPLPVVRPNSVPEVGELIRQAAAANTALYPVGGQTNTALGNPPARAGQAIDLRGLADIVDFPARDMTVTVQAGITIATLQEILAKENLRLPIDVPLPAQATLGGILAANTSGPRRYGYGTLRDYVIGISVLNDAGAETKAGGRVVKNVAGYDLCKLHIGALGTLGVITQATLKLRPLAEEQALVSVECAPENLDALLTRVHGSRTRPACIDLVSRRAARDIWAQADLPGPDAPWTILIGYEGNAEAVHWQVQQLVKEIGAHDHLFARVGFTARPWWEALNACAAWPNAQAVFKANLLPSKVASFCLEIDREPNRPALRAHAGNGIVEGVLAGDLTKESVAGMLNTWRERARAGQGSVIVSRSPTAWKAALSVWGPPPDGAWLMREIKAKFDPRGIFNPGRFVDGI